MRVRESRLFDEDAATVDGMIGTSDMAIDILSKIERREARVSIIGQGYVGLVAAMRVSEAGFAVVGLEIDPFRAGELAAGRSYIEDVSDTEVQRALAAGFVPTSDSSALAEFDIAVISVPTPLTDGLPDLSAIESAGAAIAAHLRPGALVILESTTYPGTTTELLGELLTTQTGLSPGDDFLLAYSPERIDPGNPHFSLPNTPKIVGGVDDASLAGSLAFFETFVSELVPVSTPAVAELAKLLENTFRHVNIALVNELAMFASALEIDVWEAIDAAATKPFGFMKFTPGPGVGGHCLPVDPSYLSWQIERRLGQQFRFIDLANAVNRHMPDHVVQRILLQLNRKGLAINGSNVLVLGAAYKRDTGDIRESPSLEIADRLDALGAKVTIVEPFVTADRLDARFCHENALTIGIVKSADLVVVATDHTSFDYDMVSANASAIFDTRNCITGDVVGDFERL